MSVCVCVCVCVSRKPLTEFVKLFFSASFTYPALINTTMKSFKLSKCTLLHYFPECPSSSLREVPSVGVPTIQYYYPF